MIATPTVRPVEVITSCAQGKKIIDDKNYLYAPGVAGSLWTFLQDGTGTIKILSQNKTSATTLYGAPASIQDIVLFGGVDGNLYVTAQYGKTLTSFPIGVPIFGGIAISNGRVYFGDTSGIIHCMSINGQ
jgi:outer membrane protein assembly factor BamB